MFSAELQYAILLLDEVRNSPNHEPITIEALAEKYALSEEFMYKVARKLRMAEFVASVRGPGGGYVAGKNLTDASFWEVYETIHFQNSLLKAATVKKKANAILELTHDDFKLALSNLKLR